MDQCSSPNTEPKYQLGIPTLRSATHRVRYSSKKAKGREKDKPQIEGVSSIKGDADASFTSCLPSALRGEHFLTYDTQDIDVHNALVSVLSDPSLEPLLGGWAESTERRMEHFQMNEGYWAEGGGNGVKQSWDSAEVFHIPFVTTACRWRSLVTGAAL